MHKRTNKEFIQDIIESINRIEIYVDKMNFEEFLQNIKTQDAVVRNIEIIGEAVKNISAAIREKYNNIEWRDISGIRDKIIHHYFGIKWEIVWSVIKNNLPKLKLKIEKILNEIEN